MKSFFSSRTMWFGVAQIAFGAVGYFTGWLDQNTAVGLITLGATSIGLRFKTTKAIA